jgi:hypothetical protein
MSFFVSLSNATGRDILTNFSRFISASTWLGREKIVSVLSIRLRCHDKVKIYRTISPFLSLCVWAPTIGSCHEIAPGLLSSACLLSKMTTRGQLVGWRKYPFWSFIISSELLIICRVMQLKTCENESDIDNGSLRVLPESRAVPTCAIRNQTWLG